MKPISMTHVDLHLAFSLPPTDLLRDSLLSPSYLSLHSSPFQSLNEEASGAVGESFERAKYFGDLLVRSFVVVMTHGVPVYGMAGFKKRGKNFAPCSLVVFVTFLSSKCTSNNDQNLFFTL